MLKKAFLLGVLALAGVGNGFGPKTRSNSLLRAGANDDLKVWRDTIIPAFTKKHPNIAIVFSPTPPTEYNAVLDAKLKGGTAGDLIACRPL